MGLSDLDGLSKRVQRSHHGERILRIPTARKARKKNPNKLEPKIWTGEIHHFIAG